MFTILRQMLNINGIYRHDSAKIFFKTRTSKEKSMTRKSLCLLLLFLITAQIAFAQIVKTEKKDDLSPELRKEAVAFLRETAADANNLRTPENRIGFSSEMASLMWFGDEKEARAMYQTVINDFRQLMARYDAQLSASGDEQDEPGENVPRFPFGGGDGDASRKMTKALGVRQQIASSLAEHDAQLALDFFNGVGQSVTSPKFRKQIEQGDAFFEMRLLTQIAEQNPETALRRGREILAKGYNYQLLELLQKIYEKDPGKGAAFGDEIVRKLKSGDLKNGYYNLGSLLTLGAENVDKIKAKSGKKPMFSDQSMRDIADLLVKEVLTGEEAKNSGGLAFITQIEKFSPAGAARIRLKFGETKQAGIVSAASEDIVAVGVPAPSPLPNSVSIENAPDAPAQSTKNPPGFSAKQLSREELEKEVGQARKTIAEIKDPTQKLLALGVLSSQVAAEGDKELAVRILDEAKNLVNLQPKNYLDYLRVWMLASSYAQVDAPKAFPILEDAILRLDDTLGAFIKVGEFIDVGGDMIEDGEVQLGAFGGAMTRDLLGNLGAADATVRGLAKADFARTKDLTNKFDRAEVRILAKMIVLRAVLENKKPESVE